MVWLSLGLVLVGYIWAWVDFLRWVKRKLEGKPHGKRNYLLVLYLSVGIAVFLPITLGLLFFVIGDVYSLGGLIALSAGYAFYKFGSLAVRKLRVPSSVERYRIKPADLNIRILVDPLIILPVKAFMKHVYVLAATGRGKTKGVIGPLIKQFLEKGKGVINIDPKGDNEVIAGTVDYLTKIGRKDAFLFWDPMFPYLSNSYNPLYSAIKYRKPEHIAVMVIATMPKVGGTATFYENIQKEFTRALTKLLGVLPETGKMANFMDLYAIVANLPKSIEYLLDTYSFELRKGKDEIYRYWIKTIHEEAKRNKDFRSYLRGLQQHLAIYAFNFDPKLLNSYDPEIKIPEVFKEAKALYFSLRALDYPSGETLEIGKMVLMDIQSYAAYKQRYNITSVIPDLLVIDEAQNVMIPEFQRMFEMARSAGIGVLIAHQSKQQFDQIERGLFGNIFNNTNIKLILGVDDPETAKFLAEYSGQELKFFRSESRAGEHLLRKPTDQIMPRWFEMESERYDYKIRPEEFMNLKVGEAYLFCSDPPIKGIKGKLDYFALETQKNLERIIPRKPEDTSWKDPKKGLCLLFELAREDKNFKEQVKEEMHSKGFAKHFEAEGNSKMEDKTEEDLIEEILMLENLEAQNLI